MSSPGAPAPGSDSRLGSPCYRPLSIGGTFAGTASGWYVALAADVQGNGRLDLFLGGLDDVVHLRNDGGGAFTDLGAAFALACSGGLDSLAALDVDGDLDLDLVGARLTSYKTIPPLALRNPGTGIFTTASELVTVPAAGVAELLRADIATGRPAGIAAGPGGVFLRDRCGSGARADR